MRTPAEKSTERRSVAQLYERDFYAWAAENAALIRQGRLAEIDLEHIAEELESMGRSDKRELLSRLAVLLAHLLKWRYQPERRGNSWRGTIQEQRLEIADLLAESPSLKNSLRDGLNRAYQRAIQIAVKETGWDEDRFPAACPFTVQETLDRNYWPD